MPHPAAPPAPPAAAPAAASTALHVVWPRPSLMLPMGRTVVLVNGYAVWNAPFEQGVDVTVPVPPGRHRVEVVIDVEGLFSRRRAYEIDVGGPVRLELRYSRFWGNFVKKPTVRPGP